MLRIGAVSPGTSVQDLGRRGLGHWGVAEAGAADRGALRLANRLVGNAEGSAGFECPFGGLAVSTDRPAVVAVTGARCEILVDGIGAGQDVAVALPPGARLSLGPATSGLRVYVAIRGGLDVPAVLGSRSYDSLGRLGPPPPVPGDVLPVGAGDTCGPAWWEPVAVPPVPVEPVVRVILGPRADWFPPESIHSLLTHGWKVSAASDRVGMRLGGPMLARRSGDLPSEPMLAGAVQVPPDGQPILLGPDCGTTGGYPVLAVVVEADLDLLGQLRPGDTVRFRGAL